MITRKELIRAERRTVRNLMLEAHTGSSPAVIRKCLKIANDMIDDLETGERTKQKLLEFIVKHSWAVYEHKNPPVQKSKVELTGPIEVTFRNA